MTSGPITSWKIDGETVETMSDFIFLGSKITTDGDCSHEIKRRFLLGRKVMTNVDSIFKSFKKIRDVKGRFHAKMGTIKDRNGMDLIEAEYIKKRWPRIHRRTIQKRSS